MSQIYENLYQFSYFRKEINLSNHQYLLLNSKPTLIYTGTNIVAKALLPEVEALLAGKDLANIFISHLGADECGGLSVFLERYPNVQVICSEHTMRQLIGFGIRAHFVTPKPGASISGEDYKFTFIDYPAEAHLLSGLLMYDEISGIFFSSDLMMRAGDGANQVTHSYWSEEVQATNMRQVPNRIMLRQLHKDLNSIQPRFIAVGHGYCMNVEE